MKQWEKLFNRAVKQLKAGEIDQNFFRLYRALVSSWMFYDNSPLTRPRLVAAGSRRNVVEVHDSLLYKVFLREYGDER
jgi:hypothetical protein